MAGKAQSKPLQKNDIGLSKLYLLFYNFVQFSGWSYLFYQVIKHFASGGKLETLWNTVGLTLSIFQNAAVLEIIHVAIGIVKSNLLITIAQVFSRVMMVCGALLATPTAPLSLGLPILLCAWCPTEIVRYLFYTLSLLNRVPYFLVWIRYTFFYFLYPLGVTGELLCLYAAQKYVAQNKMWSKELPNFMNATFSYHYTLLLVMLLYIPCFPQMFYHMVLQRKKVIGGQKAEKKQR